MKAAILYGPGDVRMTQIPEPEAPGTGMVLVRTEMAGLCGTDASQFRRPSMIPLFHPHEQSGHCGPVILGHEIVGTIAAVGPAVSNVQVGQRIVPGSSRWCGTCPQCQAGRPNICEHAYLSGIHAHGGMVELATYPAQMCVPVPDTCPPEVAVFAQPCAVAIHALDRAGIESEHTLLRRTFRWPWMPAGPRIKGGNTNDSCISPKSQGRSLTWGECCR